MHQASSQARGDDNIEASGSPAFSHLVEHWEDLVNKQLPPGSRASGTPRSAGPGQSDKASNRSSPAMDRQDTIKAGNMNRQGTLGAAQEQLLLAELKRVGTQQEQLKKAVSEAAAEAASRGETLEILPLKSFKMSDSKLAHLKSIQLKDQQRTQIEAAAAAQAPAEEASPIMLHAPNQTLLAESPEASARTPIEAGMDSEAQMQLLFAELKRIEGQQQQLKSAVAQNRVLVVHPPKGFHAESAEDEYAEEKEVIPDPDRFIPSGGLTGFEVAKDLMKLDFSSPEEAPEEFRAVTFNAPPAKKGMRMPSLTALEIQTQGSFGIIEEKGLKMFLKRLQEDQQDMLDLIQTREKARKKGLLEPALPALKVPSPAVQWDVGQPPSPLVRQTGPPTAFESSCPQTQEAAAGPAQPASSAVSSQPTPKVGRGAGPTPSRFGGASAAPPVPRPAAVDTAQLVAEPGEARAAPAVFAAAPVIAQQAQHAQQAHPSSRSPQLDGDQDRIAAVAAAPTQLRADTTCAPTPQAAAPTKSQTPTGAPDSPTVHKSAESIVARQPVRAASKAAAKAASQGKSVDVKEGEDDTELAPEEMGFAGHSDDAFAALRAKMELAQGKKKKKDDKKEEKKKKKTGDGAGPITAATAVAAGEEVVSVAERHLKAVVDDDTGKGKQGKHEEQEDKERRKQDEKQKKKELKQQQELQEQLEKKKKKEMKQQKEQQELEEKRRRKEMKQQERQNRQGPKAEEQEFEPEEEEEAQEAKGNSVFDAPVTNLAAGLQLGFTPSTAGKAKKKDK